MSDPRLAEALLAWHSQFAEYGVYGMNGDNAGGHAAGLAERVSARGEPMPFGIGEDPRWDHSDMWAFDSYTEVEHAFAFMDVAPVLDDDSELPEYAGAPGDHLGDLFRKIRHLNACVPFNEGERRWLLALDHHIGGSRLLATLATAEATIYSAGRRQHVDGRDLARRWPAWRRELDEFAGQGSVDEAITVLRSIARQILPESKWPPSLSEPDDR